MSVSCIGSGQVPLHNDGRWSDSCSLSSLSRVIQHWDACGAVFELYAAPRAWLPGRWSGLVLCLTSVVVCGRERVSGEHLNMYGLQVGRVAWSPSHIMESTQ
ncbi:hypothetical protein E2C01_009685 [Portunus trituberculatus]|uniref:Uncharacterized protein n=1 Tax=Portunus trituberculatus TaxID=210409 RepID=A0A5B7D6N3_PORTR|nr:hypothetical protein [Portunus trituberculatus]